MSVPIIKCIGISLGLLIWGATNMMIGWGTGTFGWFDLEAAKRPVDTPWLNDLGFALAVVSLACYIFVQPAEDPKEPPPEPLERDPEGLHETLAQPMGYDDMVKGLTKGETRHRASQCSSASNHSDKSRTSFFGAEVIEETVVERSMDAPSAIDQLPPTAKRLLGVGMAMFAGCLFGATFNPPKWVEVHRSDSPQKDIDYVFAHFCGIWLTSLLALIIYTLYNKNEPFVFPRVLGPAYVSGLMWGVAQTCWFVANDALGFSKSFPLICAGPGLVSAMWGILLFNEIQGTRNFIALGIACVFTISSSICVACS